MRLRIKSTQDFWTGLFFVAFGATVFFVLSVVSAHSDKITTDVLTSVQATYAIDVDTSDYRGAEMMHVLSSDPAEMRQHEITMERLKDQITKWRTRYEPLIDTPEEHKYYDAFSHNYAIYMKNSAEMIALSRRNDNNEAAALIKNSAALFQTMSKELEELVQLAAKQAKMVNADSDAITSRLPTLWPR